MSNLRHHYQRNDAKKTNILYYIVPILIVVLIAVSLAVKERR